MSKGFKILQEPFMPILSLASPKLSVAIPLKNTIVFGNLAQWKSACLASQCPGLGPPALWGGGMGHIYIIKSNHL